MQEVAAAPALSTDFRLRPLVAGARFDLAGIMPPVVCDIGATAFNPGMCRSLLRDLSVTQRN